MSEPEKCKVCDGNGILLGGKSGNGSEAAKKRPPYYPERHLLVRDETLDEWKTALEGDIRKHDAEIEKLKSGVDQINEEFARRAMGKAKRA